MQKVDILSARTPLASFGSMPRDSVGGRAPENLKEVLYAPLCRRICPACPEEEPSGVPPHLAEGRQDLAGARRPGVPGMRWRRPGRKDGDSLPAHGQAEAWRDR